MTSENSKAAQDATPCAIRALLHELEESDIVDTGLHAHSCERPGPQETTETGDHISIKYDVAQLSCTPKEVFFPRT